MAKKKGNSKFVFDEVKMVQIPENTLIHGVVKALEGRESFKDADLDLDERIYTGDVFEAILSENAQLTESSVMKLKKKTETQLEELAEICGMYEYVQITKI